MPYLLIIIGGAVKGKKTGDPKKLAGLIKEGRYDPETAVESTVMQLRELCKAAGILTSGNATKVKQN